MVQVFSTVLGTVGLAFPLVLPPIRHRLGYRTEQYYGPKTYVGELEYRHVARWQQRPAL